MKWNELPLNGENFRQKYFILLSFNVHYFKIFSMYYKSARRILSWNPLQIVLQCILTARTFISSYTNTQFSQNSWHNELYSSYNDYNFRNSIKIPLNANNSMSSCELLNTKLTSCFARHLINGFVNQATPTKH